MCIYTHRNTHTHIDVFMHMPIHSYTDVFTYMYTNSYIDEHIPHMHSHLDCLYNI